MFKYLLMVLISLVMAAEAIAYDPDSPPTVCPTVTDIQKIFNPTYRVSGLNGYYMVAQADRYNTPNGYWEFFIAGIPASSEEDALAKAKAALQTLSGTPSPVYAADKSYSCYYSIAYGYIATAVDTRIYDLTKATK